MAGWTGGGGGGAGQPADMAGCGIRAAERAPRCGAGVRAACVAGLKNRVPPDSRFERFLLSRTGLTPVRDIKNLSKLLSVWKPPKRCIRVHAGAHAGVGPPTPAPRKSLPVAYLHASTATGNGFVRSRRRLAGLQLASRRLGCRRPPARADPPALDPTPTHPVLPPLPEPGVGPASRGGGVGSRREHRVQGGFEGVQVCDGSAARR